MKAPCSGAICITEMPPSFAVSSISARATSSGGAPCATRYSWSAGVIGVCFGAVDMSLPFLHREPRGDRLLVLGLGDHPLPLIEAGEAGVAEGFVRLELDQPPRGGDRAVEIARALERHGEAVPRDREPGVELERAPVAGHGLVDAAGREVREGLALEGACVGHASSVGGPAAPG